MKKIMITGMAFLIAMTALAGCGNVTDRKCSLLSCKCRWHGNGSDRSKDFGWNYPYRF